MKRYILVVLVISSMVLFNQMYVNAQPPQPAGYYGSVNINGEAAEAGTILVPLIKGVEYPSRDTVKTDGEFGLLFVHGDDPSTPATKEGGVFNDEVVFKAITTINEYIMSPKSAWVSGVNQELSLINQDYIPVELASFQAKVRNNSILLDWTTESETNNLGFEVQKSRENQKYLKIAFVEGHGTSSIPHHYQYEDKNQAAGKHFYRLKQIDTDGSFEFSNSVIVNLETTNNYKLYQNFPNPFNPSTTIRFHIYREGQVELNIHNIKGELVHRLVNKNFPPGDHQIDWHGTDSQHKKVPNGVYIYSLKSVNFKISRKMILMR